MIRARLCIPGKVPTNDAMSCQDMTLVAQQPSPSLLMLSLIQRAVTSVQAWKGRGLWRYNSLFSKYKSGISFSKNEISSVNILSMERSQINMSWEQQLCICLWLSGNCWFSTSDRDQARIHEWARSTAEVGLRHQERPYIWCSVWGNGSPDSALILHWLENSWRRRLARRRPHR